MAEARLSALPIAERHRVVAATFGDRVRGTVDWAATTPVDGWVARDVVAHLVSWLPGLLGSGSAVELPHGPTVEDDPVAAWEAHASSVQRVLDDSGTAESLLTNPHIGELPVAQAIDRFYTADVFMHTWDLARATGQDDRLDEDFAAELLAGMQPMEQVMRESGQYGSAVPVASDAPVQDHLMGFIGRDPAWRPETDAAR